MIVNKHLICQTVIVPYMENTNSDILGLGITSLLMWISNRGHVFRFGGIILHLTGVFSNVLMQNKRHCQKTSDWSVIVPYKNTDSDILGLRLTSSLMWISNRDCIGGIVHPTGVFSNVLMQKKRHESRTTSDQKVIVYMIDGDNDIMFTIKVFEMKFCMDVYVERRHCLTIFEPGIIRNT